MPRKIKKIIPYFLLLLLFIVVGIFSPIVKVHAATFSDCIIIPGNTPGDCRGLEGDPAITTNSTYNLLAPLPDPGNNGTPMNSFDPTSTGSDALSKYLNLMIKLFIGICAVLAVIMIVMGGIEYMTSELISSKQAGKDRILHAIFGLILALGAWTILNTINPKLLNTDLKSLANVTVEVMLEEETPATAVTGTDVPTSTQPTASCAQGIQKTTSGMYACGSVAQNLDKMVAAAKAAGCNLSGGGYRSPEAQKQLRISNCNGDYKNRSATCHPPTALPGLSRHNNGLAFDLKSNGTLIQSKDNSCYKWLSTNAGNYGLKNLQSEPWHWSTDGR
jgi:type IV secretory pathway VirB2 component (pilin)